MRPRSYDGLPPHVLAICLQAEADGAPPVVLRDGASAPRELLFWGVPARSITEQLLCGLAEARATGPTDWRWAPDAN